MPLLLVLEMLKVSVLSYKFPRLVEGKLDHILLWCPTPWARLFMSALETISFFREERWRARLSIELPKDEVVFLER